MSKLLLFLCAAAALAPAAAPVAVEGLDPVRLVEGKLEDGKPAVVEEHEGLTYQFVSEETRAVFRKDPGRYAAQLNGACARMGPPVRGVPEAYHVYEGRIYLFGSSDCYKAFVEDPARYLESKHPQARWDATPAAIERARKLWTSIDGAATLAEHRANQLRIYSAAGGVVVERAFNGRVSRQVMQPDSAFSVFDGNLQPMKPAFAAAAHRAIRRDLLHLLLARDLDMYYTGHKDGLDWVAIRSGGVVTQAAIAADGSVARLAHTGRGPDSSFGQVTIHFSHFCDVGDRKLPHRADAFFNGAPAPQLGWTVEKYEWNPPGAEERFSPPPVKAQ
jgi:YHS domain-containing protein